MLLSPSCLQDREPKRRRVSTFSLHLSSSSTLFRTCAFLGVECMEIHLQSCFRTGSSLHRPRKSPASTPLIRSCRRGMDVRLRMYVCYILTRRHTRTRRNSHEPRAFQKTNIMEPLHWELESMLASHRTASRYITFHHVACGRMRVPLCVWWSDERLSTLPPSHPTDAHAFVLCSRE